MRVHPRAILLLILSAGAFAPGPAHARPDEGFIRPDAARRTVRLWDFEERPQNVEPVPREWVRNQTNPPDAPRPGFPAWNLAAFDDTLAYRGNTSVKLPTRGGSTALSLIRGVLPAMPGGRYAVSAYVRTEGLVHARAFVRVALLDAAQQPLNTLGTVAVSEPVITPEAGEGAGWVKVNTLLEGSEDGAWLQIDLELLQPAQMRRDGDKPLTYEITQQDYEGAAWFDDVRIEQVPRVDLVSADHTGVSIAPERPELRLRVQDLTGESLRVRVVVTDIDGTEVDTLDTPVESGGRVLAWKPVLPWFGFYRARMEVLGPQGLAAERSTQFAWVAPTRPLDRGSRRGWGVIAESLESRRVPMLPELLDLCGAGAVSLSVWSHVGIGELDEGDRRSRTEIDAVVNQLVERRHDITFVLGRAPEALAREARADADDPIVVLAGPTEVWMPGLTSLLSRFGERVNRWQVGPTGSDRSFWRPTLARDLNHIERGFRGLVPRATMTAPWRIEHSVAAVAGQRSGVDALTVVVPSTVPAWSIPEYAAEWSQLSTSGPGSAPTTPPEIALVLEGADAETFGEREMAEDLARRAAMAWSAEVPRSSIRLPFLFDAGDAARALPSALPTPELVAWRTISSALSGRWYAGRLPIAPGVTAILAQGEGKTTGAVVAWNDFATDDDARLAGYLGTSEIIITDVFGNARTSTPDDSGRHLIPLSQAPIIVEGVDVNLLRLRAGVHLSPAALPARAERHSLSVVIQNPWDQPVSGTLRLAEPIEWEMAPRVIPFVLQAGQERSFPFTASLGVGEASGQRWVRAELEITSDRRYPTIRLDLPIEVGLDTIQMQPSYRYLPGADGTMTDLMISILVTNLDSRPVTLESFVAAPGLRSQQAPISALGPGESAIRRFVFPGAAKTLRGKRLLTGLKEMGGTGRLNRVLEIQ
ncbi:MAG: hypothetical protein ACKVZJ_06590 [Phycisphaerales bacterium]